MAKRTYRGCTCGCGTGTYGNYAPGHDAKHVARLVSWVQESWTDGYGGETSVRWERALKNLPTDALRSKFRKAMVTRAAKLRQQEIKAMNDANWQRQLHLAYMITRVDAAFTWMTKTTADALLVAEIAAAMGLTVRGVNYRNS